MAVRDGDPRQGSLLPDGEGEPARPSRGKAIEPAPPAAADVEAAAEIPANVRFGTSSWSFPGWEGIVYATKASDRLLSQRGLAAYASHPLLRTVGLDRTHYAPLEADQYREHAGQVPEDFRFLVKAHEALTLHTWPKHARYGQRKGLPNDRFLAPEYAARHCIEPMVGGLGPKAGPLLFQFAPQNLKELGGADAFVGRIHAFLRALPRGPQYAVEVRNPELLTDEYAAALADAGAVHCVNSLRRMPPLVQQWQKAGLAAAKTLIVRWMVHRSQDYESALDRYEPFDHIVDEDLETRREIAALVAQAALDAQEVYVIVNNKAEGSAPLSVFALARGVAAEIRRD
jgi:uncharacterized protein YecE (DUF72 family)